MNDQERHEEPNVYADNTSIAIGGISVGGNVGDISIGHTIGFTSDQVSTLITQISTTLQPKSFDGRCPYKGLDVFEEEDAEMFFGREKLVDDLVSRIKESRTLFVTGPSGSGKSSLVRAGLIHTLKQGVIKELDSDHWLYATMKPGRDPIEAMAGAFSRLKSPELGDYFQKNAAKPESLHKCAESVLTERQDQRLVLLIDQFEEVFTQLSKDNTETFIQLLDRTATIQNGRVIVLFAMRSDFVSNCATYPQLNALLNRQFVQIGAMHPEELVSAIAQPALRVGLKIDPDLIAQIINDMQGEPGALPLMQFALKDLFDAQQVKGGMIALTLNDYLNHGGIHKALERHADNSFHKLDGHEQELARSIFTGLIEIGRGTQDTRRTALFDELVPASAEAAEVQAIVHKLADARLITTDETSGKDTVTISHEKLIDAWPWLKKLVNENRDVIALQNEITTDAKEWDERERDDSYLYSGARLVTAQEKIRAKTIVLSDLSRAFVETGIQREETARRAAEEQRQRERDRQLSMQRQRRSLIWISTALVVSILLAIAAIVSGISALRQSQRALASELAAQATNLVNAQPDLSLLLSLESNYIGDQLGESDPIWLGSLITSLNSSSQSGTYLYAHEGDVRAVAFSPDGHWLVTTGNPFGNRGQVILWDMTSSTNPRLSQKFVGGTERFLAVAFRPDSKVFVAAGDDQKLYAWDPAKCCDPIDVWSLPNTIRALNFLELNGKELVAVASGSEVTFWNMNNGSQQTSFTLKVPTDDANLRLLSLAVSPDNAELAAGSDDGNLTVWDLNTLKIKFHVCNYGDPETNDLTVCVSSGQGNTDVRSLAFNGDGTLLIAGSSDYRVWLWDTATGQMLTRSPEGSEGGHINTVSGVAFNPQDDHEIATVSWDNTVNLWKIVEGETWSLKRVDTLAGHSSPIWTLAYSPDGNTLATAGSDKSIILWKLNQLNQIGTSITHMDGEVWALAATSDGSQFAAGDESGNIRIWDFKSGQLSNPISLTHPGGVRALAFSHDSKWLASAGYENTIRVWDLKTGREAWQIEQAHRDAIWAVMFNHNDTKLASASYDQTAKLWDTASHRQVGKSLEHPSQIYALTFNEDGTQLLTAGLNNSIYVWDVTNPISPPNPTLLVGHTAAVNSLAFNPTHPALFASTSDDKTLLIWNVIAYEHTEPVIDITESMEAVTFSPNGEWLASGTNNNTVQLWKLDSERCSKTWDRDSCQPNRLGTPLVGHNAQVQNVAFLSDTVLVSSSADGQLILWNLDKSFWYKHACEIVNRPFTQSEYSQYFEGRINLDLLNVLSWFANLFGSNQSVEPPPCISQ